MIFACLYCAAADVQVGDAYIKGSHDEKTWTIGTRAMEVVFGQRGGQFGAISFQNKISLPPREYVSAEAAGPLFAVPTGTNESQWTLEGGVARSVTVGGRPAGEFDGILKCESLQAQLQVIVYPGTSVMRQWLVIRNTGSIPLTVHSPVLFSLNLRPDDATSFTNFWMAGGNNAANEGQLEEAAVTPGYHRVINGVMTRDFVPWMAMQRGGDPGDGWFIGLDFLGAWQLAGDWTTPDSLVASATVRDSVTLAPGEELQLPTITLGVFHENLDDLAQRVYDWQYEYLWDYTRDDYYAKMEWDSAWYNGDFNLQENFAGRLGELDMDFADMMRTVGMEVLWDDAGWSENPNIWTPSREGPDFEQTQRYLAKMGMKWALWFCGRPTAGLMDTKVGSWGDFQWRTDGIGDFNLASDQAYRKQITRFRRIHPRSSFQTCNGGGTYAQGAFDIQRYADINMFSDPGGGDLKNYYLSYLDTPDKWMDLMPSFDSRGVYEPATSRQILTMLPCWDLYASGRDQEQLRRIADLYHYLLHEGVAGRWSYMFHPRVRGDAPYYYLQRTSHDRQRVCIILKHKADGLVTIYPNGLLSGHEYVVGFDSTERTTNRSGADLMANGIAIRNQVPGELIYLGLPNRPGGGLDKVAPQPPGRVFTRRETNLGYGGVGVYWSPGTDNNWISYYEVRRGDKILGKASTGTYYFDHSPGWDPQATYSVRTVDGDGNVSAWTEGSSLANEPLEFSALGGLFSGQGREGWRAETSTDGQTFLPMTWVPPARNSAGDANGTPNQPGGAEGYWQGAGSARIGRGWQQASTNVECVRTWIAPRAGRVRIVGRAIKEYYRRNKGRPLRVRITHGPEQVWPNEGWAMVPLNDLAGCTHDFTVEVKAGDAIRFVLDRGTDPQNDIIAWMPRMVYAATGESNTNLSVVRILCGAQKAAVQGARRWSADEFHRGGEAISTEPGHDRKRVGSGDRVFYRTARRGRDFSYAIPVAPGLYTLRLKFAEPKYKWFFERPFNLSINGRQVLDNFDICQAARGPDRPCTRVFRYLVPDAAGQLVLHFWRGNGPLQESGEALVNAIEVVPALKPTIRINVGSDTEFVDWNSFVWSADSHFRGGKEIRPSSPVSQATPTLYDQALYQSARTGRTFSYSIPVVPGLYSVQLKFAELWLREPGQRPMNIEINGRHLWTAWDPLTAAGQAGMAANIRAEDITPDSDGNITIRVSASGPNDAILQGIEIQ